MVTVPCLLEVFLLSKLSLLVEDPGKIETNEECGCLVPLRIGLDTECLTLGSTNVSNLKCERLLINLYGT